MSIYCSGCGRSIPDDSNVCPYCGKKIEITEKSLRKVESEQKDKTALIIAVVVIVVVAIPILIAIAATFFVYSSSIASYEMISDMQTPSVLFSKDDTENTLTVIMTTTSDSWSSILINGEGTLPSGSIDEYDVITGCSGTVTLTWEPTNTLLGSWTFS